MTSYIVYYNSMSHKRTRYFVGMEQKKCGSPLCPGKHLAPSWDYDKENATILDGLKAATQAKQFAEKCGYKNLVIEPIDELKAPPVKLEEKIT